jgi:hypothetical protein
MSAVAKKDADGAHLEKEDPILELPLNLPAPRIWTPKHLGEFLSVSASWIYKRTERNAEDPIPRIPGCGRLRFDTNSIAFQDWMRRQLGYIDEDGRSE